MKALRSRALSDVLTKSDHGERKCERERDSVCIYIYICYVYIHYIYIYIYTRNGSMYPYSMYSARKVLT